MVNQWLNFNLSSFCANHCLLCGETCQEQALCQECQQDLQQNHHACRRCAEPLATTYENSVCGKCLSKQPYFDLVISPYLYKPPTDRLITRFKFHSDHTAGRLLAELLTRHIAENVQQLPECIIPVPLHSSRLRKRGFNQAQELCRVLSKQLEIPINYKDCTRVQKTSSQAGLNEKQRRRNIRGAFKASKPFPYKHVAIVDDVMTTGNTVNEMAKVLRQAGTEKIQVWTICRAANWK